LSKHFADYAIYNTNDTNVLIVAKRTGHLPEPSFDRVLAGPLAAELARVGLKGPDDLLVRRTGSRAVLEALLAEAHVPVNSDYFPFLDLNAGAARFREDTATLLHAWSTASLPLLEMLDVANLHYREVTADDTFQRTQLIRNAQASLSVLRGDTPAGSGSDTAVTDLLRALRPSCAAGFERSWTDALHALARETLPYLDADAGAELLTAAAPLACRDRLSSDTRQWLDLYTAVAARDGRAMADVAEQLVHRTTTVDRKRYALTAAMLGRVATHESGGAIALYETYKDLVGDLRSSPEIRLILALAKNR
jgi:hypothetical protein